MSFQGDRCAEEGSRVLLVEGKDDCHVVRGLLRSRKIERTFGIFACESYEGLLSRANALVLAPTELQTLGLVLDANLVGPAARWQAIRDKLKRHDYDFPRSLPTEGAVVPGKSHTPRLGVWVMPDNHSKGSVEDFCLQLIDEKDLDVVREAVQLGKDRKVAQFKRVHKSKALVHTYLAWQDEPGKPMGQNIAGGRLPSDTPTAMSFVQWLARLFELETSRDEETSHA